MNHSVAAAAAAADRCERVVCPKPRRLGLPLRWHSSNQQEAFDSKAGNELLDIIVLAKTYNEEAKASERIHKGSSTVSLEEAKAQGEGAAGGGALPGGAISDGGGGPRRLGNRRRLL
ncbi:uncharacterized protein LOC127261287 isoform X2 [Andrographis paniculata]|uniref:uncharacterized protein LOC127261287 isoform X2 n=1 Tax=Andrographis paniculata TaxID=175694 RepID=UPI0021E8885A|nr:uncharacterized protein LOC127261287 isoform X2 [Andrographis paniculata]